MEGDSGSGRPVVELDGPALFSMENARDLFRGKRVVFIGDSNMRSVYKDLLVLLRDGVISHVQHFKAKMENQFKDDRLVDHGEFSKGRDYREVRYYRLNEFDVTFAFVTKCWPNYYLRDLLTQVREGTAPHPDLIVMCSMLWDISRYGPDGVDDFRRSLPELAAEVKRSLKPGTFLWVTNPPVGPTVTAPFLVKELGFMSDLMRFHVMMANEYSVKVMRDAEVDAFDLHYYLCYVTDLRDVDGTHWKPEGVRLMLCLLMTHICVAWGLPLPRAWKAESEIMEDINYDRLIRSLVDLSGEHGWPEWLRKMTMKNFELFKHLEGFALQ